MPNENIPNPHQDPTDKHANQGGERQSQGQDGSHTQASPRQEPAQGHPQRQDQINTRRRTDEDD